MHEKRWSGGPARWMLAVAALLAGTAALAAVERVPDGYRFTYKDARAGVVALAGDWNGWAAGASPMAKQDGVWAIVVALTPGDHEYKFLVDGQWAADPDNPTTVGEYGNSALSIAPDGSLAALATTSNTTLSPKILLGGRAIALYQYREDDGQDRFELDRPNLDFDLNFNVRINEDLDAHLVANVNNESENVEFYQTRLNFDRGSLTLDNAAIYLQAWDNEGIAAWGDPLHLVGAVGIYDHLYGFGVVGARVRKTVLGVDAEALYSDDAGAGSTSHPGAGRDGILERLERDEASGAYHIGAVTPFDYRYFDTSFQEDVAAARLRRNFETAPGRVLSVQGLVRLDRGSRPGAFSTLDADRADPELRTGTLRTYANTFESWLGGGIHASYQARPDVMVEAEWLHGRAWIDATGGTAARYHIGTREGGEPEPILEPLTAETPAKNDAFDLDTSTRSHLGGRWSGAPAQLSIAASWEHESHELDPFATGLAGSLKNALSVYRVDMERDWALLPALGRPVKAGLGFEYNDLSYEAHTPWSTQFWFSERNFWLDQGAHEVSYARLTLLGGRDAMLVTPRAAVRVHEARAVELSYRGTLGGEGLDRKPKYFESILSARGDLTRNWKALIDHRIARYDVPALELDDTWSASFLELSFEPADGVSFALSYGVDPYVIDAPVNEYAYIGRDQFLFGAGANVEAARDGFLELGRVISEAEQRLADERRVQLEARLTF